MPMVLKGLARLNRLRYKAGQSLTKKKKWLRKLGDVKMLLSGDEVDWDQLHKAWCAFYFIRNTLPRELVIRAYSQLEPPKGIYRHLCWSHTWRDEGAVIVKYTGKRNPTDLFAWAATSNYFPVFSEPAWVYLKNFLLTLDALAPNFFPEGVSV